MKKLLIDARMWSATGIGTYLRGLVEYLDNPEIAFEKFLITNPEDSRKLNFKSFKKIESDVPIYTLKEHIAIPGAIRNVSPDLVHFPHLNVPFFYRGPYVMTLHDLTTTRFSNNPGLKALIKKYLQFPVIKNAVSHSKKIIVPSNFVKNDVEKEFSSSAGKVITIYEGAGKTAGGVNDPDQRHRFALYVGNLFSHKNMEFVVRNWGEVTRRTHLSLIIVGEGVVRASLEDYARRNSLPITFKGRVSDNELADLYKRAHVFLFPSLSEGFGLPPLEAMGYGLPVVSSNASCMPEVLGDAALFFDPEDPNEMGDQLERVVEDEELRKMLIARGHEQAAKYSWKKMGDETLAVYNSILGT